VREATDEGWSPMGSGPAPWELRLAELPRESVPTLESVRLANEVKTGFRWA